MLEYAIRDLLRNPTRTLASLLGVVLGVGLFSGVLFFVDGSGASMTKRAIAPVTIDVQTVLTSPLGEQVRLFQRVSPRGSLRAGETVEIRLRVENRGTAPANEVVVNDKLPPALAYVPGSARRGRAPIPDVGGRSPFAYGRAGIGHNLGTLRPGGSVRLSYRARVRHAAQSSSALGLQATVSTRENVVPRPANAAQVSSLLDLRNGIAQVPGIVAADQLAFAELPPGSLRAGGHVVRRPIKVFGFDGRYAERHRSIRLAAGSLGPSSAVLSAEASRALGGAGPGATIQLDVPGGPGPVSLRVGGIADLSRARSLFDSRQGGKLEDFLYVPDSIVVSPELFQRHVLPAFRQAIAARGTALSVKSPPTLEVDVLVDRSRLAADPATAFGQTRTIAKRIEKIAVGRSYLLDNISNALAVARTDASVARRMFLFLGLPGLLLAALLAAYAGSVLAAAQRREQANLRLRGASAGQLARILAYRTAMLAGAGSLLGALVGLGSVLVVLGPSSLLEARTGALLQSLLIAVGAGLAATGLALYLPGRRALRRDVSSERRELAVGSSPWWRRYRLDYAAAALVAVAVLLALRGGAFDAPVASVSTGRAAGLRPALLLLPLGAWVLGTLVSVRAFEALARRLPVAQAPRFGPVVGGVLARSLRRRPAALVTGIVGVALVIGFGIGLAFFASTYDAAKQADARFTVGSDIRVTPSPLSRIAHPPGYAARLDVPGVGAVTPVVAGRENAFVRTSANSDVKDLAAIDPAGFAATAALSDAFFPGSTAAAAMAALEAHPAGILVDPDTADVLKLEPGGKADVLLARGTKHQVLRKLTVVGLVDRLPGFPEGVQVVANLAYYRAQTGIDDVDLFLARTSDGSSAGLARGVAALEAGPAAHDQLGIDTTETTFNKDQSSLTALNIRGLVDLNSVFTLAISAAVIAIFVFGLMLQRRREYVTLRAQGLAARPLQLLVLGEAAFVSLSGLVAGVAVGTVFGLLLVHVLQPLFLLVPVATVPVSRAAVLAALVLAATGASTAAALTILRRLSPSEVLREQ